MMVSDIGRYAHQWLAQVDEASLLGHVAAGAYLLLPIERVVLLSFGKFRGPLTLNLTENAQAIDQMPVGALVKVYPNRLYFPSIGLTINRGEAAIWEATPPRKAALPPSVCHTNLINLSHLVLEMRSPGQLAGLIPWVLGLLDSHPPSQNEFLPFIAQLRHALLLGDPSAIATAIQPVLGMGRGLTPSADDLTLGLLLAIHRWGRVFRPELGIDILSQALRRLDFRKTTTLAANLIECALDGQADERLILALDGLVCGEPELTTCAEYLLSWGHSSGVDALVGMALLMNLDQPLL